MKDNKIIRTLGYFLFINVCCVGVFHLWAFCGLAFNDTDSTFASYFEFFRTVLIMFMLPLTIAYVLFVRYFSKKKDLSKVLLYCLEIVVIVIWILVYMVNYMPNSEITIGIKRISDNKYLGDQQGINDRAISELAGNNYIELDSIKDEKQHLKVYKKIDNSTVIFEYKTNYDNSTNYCVIIPEIKYNNMTSEMNRFTKVNTNFSIITGYNEYIQKFGSYMKTALYFTLDNGEYLALQGDDLKIYKESEAIELFDIYTQLINQSIYNGECIYMPKDIAFFEISNDNNIIYISDETYSNYLNKNNKIYYKWVITKNGRHVVTLPMESASFKIEGVDKKYFSEGGEYEINIKTLYNSVNINVSNSIYFKI